MRLALTALALLLLGAAPVAAEAPGQGISLELNKLETVDNACRAYVVLQNGTGTAFSTLRYDLVIFDAEGIVARRLALEAAPLGTGKTSLKVFDLDALSCDGIGRILVNGILDCADQSGARSDCLALVRTSSRNNVALIK